MSDPAEVPSEEAIAEAIPADDRNDQNFKLLADIPVRLSVEVGSISKRLAEVLSYKQGEVIELDRQANELLDIMVNGMLVAKGEVVTIDGRFGVKIVELAKKQSAFPAFERR